MIFQSQIGNCDIALTIVIVYTTNDGLNVYTYSRIYSSKSTNFERLGRQTYGKNSKQKLEEAQAQQDEQAQEEQAQTSNGPDFKSDRDEVRHASEQFFRSLFRAGVHAAMAPVYILPEESREHFFTAGREFTRGLSSPCARNRRRF